MTTRGRCSRSIAAAFFTFLLTLIWTLDAGNAVAGTCGNGVLEAGEECDPGSPLGSRDCNTLCRRIEFEPPGLPFVVSQESAPAEAAPSGSDALDAPQIFAPRLQCQPRGVRDGARTLDPVRARYRIHLCQTSKGTDSFTTQQVRDVMAHAAADFARGGILLEEEALVRFSDNDCDVPLGGKDWTSALVANTPPGVIAIGFVKAISNPSSQFGIGGYCDFFGPLCVNAGAFDTLVIHELGHFFGLAHTFECAYGAGTEEGCAGDGDMICDTPPDRGPSGVNGIAWCEDDSLLNGSCKGSCGDKVCTDGSRPDGYNWMSYYDCMPGRFSAEQQDFMRCTLDHELLSYNADGPASTTTTTLRDLVCGDANEDGKLSAADALVVLRAGVGTTACPGWLCDFDGSGLVTASDALGILKAAVGSGLPAQCPAN
ncbi:MAG: M43 family zinc metalloprotease [Candidatus Binatia bacterium]